MFASYPTTTFSPFSGNGNVSPFEIFHFKYISIGSEQITKQLVVVFFFE